MRKDKMLAPWAEVRMISDFNEPKLLYKLLPWVVGRGGGAELELRRSGNSLGPSQ